MTENEIKLIEIIRTSENPEQALIVASDIILGFLKQLESSEAQAPACPLESA